MACGTGQGHRRLGRRSRGQGRRCPSEGFPHTTYFGLCTGMGRGGDDFMPAAAAKDVTAGLGPAKEGVGAAAATAAEAAGVAWEAMAAADAAAARVRGELLGVTAWDVLSFTPELRHLDAYIGAAEVRRGVGVPRRPQQPVRVRDVGESARRVAR